MSEPKKCKVCLIDLGETTDPIGEMCSDCYNKTEITEVVVPEEIKNEG